jgi:two-component system sensor histidine kinase UhpB
MSLFWKVFAVNALVLITAGMTLALSPATVSRPITLREAAILVAGVCALLVVNLALMHRAFAPLSRLTSGMANVDPLKPGLRLDVHDDPELGALAASFNAMADRLEGERRASSARMLIAQEDDRRRIAGELHDEVGQQLTALLLTLDRLAVQPDPDVQREARAARELVRGSLQQLRTLVRGLRPPGLDELGLTAALTALSRQVGERAGLTVTRRLDSVPDDIDPAAALVVYRVAQECLTNSARHAPRARVELALSAAPGRLELRVSDDGPGMDADRATDGSGIRFMRERALMVAASLDLTSSPGSGTVVTLTVPLGSNGGSPA